MPEDEPKSRLDTAPLVGELTELHRPGDGTDVRVWAPRGCKLSRRAHLRVWYERPDPQPVRQLRDLLRQLADELEGVDGCEVYKRNLRIRADSLQSYLDDGPPLFPPDAGPEERELQRFIERASEELARIPSRCAEVLTG